MGKIKIYTIVLCMIFLITAGCVEDNADMNNTTGTGMDNNTEIISPVESGNHDYSYLVNAGSAADYDIAEADNAFAFDLYSNIKSSGNVFFSPYSIFTAMAICYDGAKGLTKEQLSDVFYYPLNKSALEISSKEMIDTLNSETEYYEMNTANALWVQNDYPLNVQFVNGVKTYYSGNVSNLDFAGEPAQSADTINSWVEEQTNNKIKDLVPESSIDPGTAMIITNAVYFNGTWLNKFDPQDTRKETFYSSDGGESSVDMMYTSYQYNYAENDNKRIIELPYKGRDLSMYVVLPQENNIGDMENSLSPAGYDALKSNMSQANIIHLWMPKFTFDTKSELSGQLSDMGAADAFSDSADFSGIYDTDKVSAGNGLKIDEVIHQAFIDVQEEGTEAAGATAVEVTTTSVPLEQPETIEFKVDHPFMFFIEDKRTGCILFMGKVETPEY